MKASPTTTSKKRGRKTILDAKLQKQICDLLAAGNTIKTVADAVGISERVYFEWCERYPHFLQATTRARAKAKIKLVQLVSSAALSDWRAAAFLLERMFPEEFGRCALREPLQVEGDDRSAVPSINLTVEQDEHSEIALAIAHGDEEAEELLAKFEAMRRRSQEREKQSRLKWGLPVSETDQRK